MFTNKKGIYVIAFALLCLLSMQGMWLYYAISQEKRFLNNHTREAALATIASLEQKEDSRLLITSLDTLLKFPDQKIPKARGGESEVRVIVKDNTRRVFVKSRSKESVASAYSFSTTDDKQQHIEVFSNEIRLDQPTAKRSKEKLKHYEHLLKRIAFEAQPRNIKIEDRIKFPEVIKALQKSLVERGIDLNAEVAVASGSNAPVFKTPGFVSEGSIALPLFSRDVFAKDYRLMIYYPSTLSYIFRKALSVIVLSVFVTILLIAVILLLYRKMMSEQKLNQYKNDFINNLTHELKTPLATISLANSNIAAAAGYSKQENIRQYTSIIDEENKKLNSHIEKVFELSMLSRGKNIFSEETCDAHDLLSDTLKQNAQLLQGATVTTKFAAANSKIKVDRFHFNNLIGNLLDNAVKYSTAPAQITISTSNMGDKLYVSVLDKGQGISREHQKYIFDKFFRVTDKDLHTTKGFGVGLSYAKQAVELFGGSISVKSELNKGSEFTIELPYAKS